MEYQASTVVCASVRECTLDGRSLGLFGFIKQAEG
jgi:hypothetical protein